MTLQVAPTSMTNYGHPLPIDYFHLQLETGPSGRRGHFSPGEEITGKLTMTNSEPFTCMRIYVALEGAANVTYQSGHATRERSESILPEDDEWTTVYFLGAPFLQLPVTDSNYRPPNSFSVKKATHEYQFVIPIRKMNPFPGSFSGSSGEIVYRVAGYVDTGYAANLKTSKKAIKIDGYMNLRSNPDLLRPGTIDAQQYKSIFSKKTGIKYSLTTGRTGFLPEESIPFTLNVLNPSGKTIIRVFVGLVKKVGYTSDLSSRWSRAVLDGQEITDPGFFALESTDWADSLTIPKDSYLSISSLIVKHIYTIRVEITTEGNDYPALKGDIPITIGTIRELDCLTAIDENGPIARSISITSHSSTLKPPTYSQLSSRRSSAETLPPLYDEAVSTPDAAEEKEAAE